MRMKFLFLLQNAKEIALTQSCDESSVHYNSIKHTGDVSCVLYGAIMNLNWPITASAISQTFYKVIYLFLDITQLRPGMKLDPISYIQPLH